MEGETISLGASGILGVVGAVTLLEEGTGALGADGPEAVGILFPFGTEVEEELSDAEGATVLPEVDGFSELPDRDGMAEPAAADGAALEGLETLGVTGRLVLLGDAGVLLTGTEAEG